MLEAQGKQVFQGFGLVRRLNAKSDLCLKQTGNRAFSRQHPFLDGFYLFYNCLRCIAAQDILAGKRMIFQLSGMKEAVG